MLRDLGVTYSAGSPEETLALDHKKLIPLPSGPLSLLHSQLLDTADKLEFLRLLSASALPRVSARDLAHVSVQEWIDRNLRRPRVCRLVSARIVSGVRVEQLDPRQPNDPPANERDLEGLVDAAQPGWRELVVKRVYLPHIEAVSALPLASRGGFAGRTGPRVPGLDNLYLAGDWIGPRGFLSDASFASGREAAQMVLQFQRGALRQPDLRHRSAA